MDALTVESSQLLTTNLPLEVKNVNDQIVSVGVVSMINLELL